MFVMTVAVVLLSVAFLFFVRSLVNKNQEMELKVSEDVVFQKLEESRAANEFGSKFGESLGSIQGLPYYITYIVYNAKDFTLLATNDPFLPYLEDSHGKVKYYFEKNYFFCYFSEFCMRIFLKNFYLLSFFLLIRLLLYHS